MRKLLLLGAAIFMLSACSSEESSENTAKANEGILSEETVDAILPGSVKAEMVYEREGEVEVKARQVVGLSDEQTYKLAKVQAVNTFKAIQEADFDGIKTVTVRMVADGVDKNGNDSADFELFTVTLDADKLDELNFTQVGFDRIKEVASEYESTEK